MNRRSFALLSASAALSPLPAAARTLTQEQVESELFALEDRWVAAEIGKDAETLRQILHEKFHFFYDDGPPRDRETFISGIVDATDSSVVSQELTERHVIFDGDTAMLIENDRIGISRSGVVSFDDVRLATTYIRRKGRWRALSEYMHPIESAGAE